MKKRSKRSKNVHLEKVAVKCQAIEMGQHQGRLIHPMEKFTYQGNVVNGKLPLWVAPIDEEAEEEFKFNKLSESEKAQFRKNKAVNVDEDKIRKDIESEIRAEERAKIEDEMREKIRAELKAEMESEGEESEESAPDHGEDFGHHEPEGEESQGEPSSPIV